MRRIFLITAIILLLPVIAVAQTESLLTNIKVSGGYGGPSMKFVHAYGEAALLIGGQGAFVFNSRFALGASGWGLATDHKTTNSTGTEYSCYFNYGGLHLEYLSNPEELLHHYFDVNICWGSLNFTEVGSASGSEEPEDSLFILEPGAHMTLNLFQTFRVAAGVDYRFVFGFEDTTFDLYGLSKSDIEGYAITLTFRFGRY